VLPKLADGRFYPHAWTATPAPQFVAMIDAMSGLRSLANSAGQGFSLYLSPKYLDSSRYQSAATNLDSLAGILGTRLGRRRSAGRLRLREQPAGDRHDDGQLRRPHRDPCCA
jgi:DNA-binding PucR family transcriptional regulator